MTCVRGLTGLSRAYVSGYGFVMAVYKDESGNKQAQVTVNDPVAICQGFFRGLSAVHLPADTIII